MANHTVLCYSFQHFSTITKFCDKPNYPLEIKLVDKFLVHPFSVAFTEAYKH